VGQLVGHGAADKKCIASVVLQTIFSRVIQVVGSSEFVASPGEGAN
jgi:hypothetical protein